MCKKDHIRGILAGVAVEPFALLLGILSGGTGHGNYFLAKLLFPFTMLSTIELQKITAMYIAIAIVQFPFYGWLIGLSHRSSLSFAPLCDISAILGGNRFVYIFKNNNISVT